MASALAVVLAGTALPAPAAADTSTVTFQGVTVTVPSSWPVVDLDGRTGCVRFDRHAVYLGDPVASNCPAEISGHVEAVHVTRGSVTDARSPSAKTGASRTVTGGTAIHPDLVVSNSPSPVQVVVTSGADQSLAKEIADSVRYTAATQSGGASGAQRSFGASAAQPRTLMAAPQRQTAKASARAAGGPTFTGLGFDACTAPSINAMRAWLSSPYRAVNIYIGGASRGCGQLELNASWVNTVVGMGWTLIPTYVGLQAPCSKFRNRVSSSKAAAQGSSSADDSVAIMQSLGLGAGSPIYFDMEAFDYTNKSCLGTVQKFLDAWTARLHARDFLSGVYTSSNTMGPLLAAKQGDASFHQPDDIWFARWNNSTATTGDPQIPDQYWADHQRIHQYRGGHTETWGGVTINIDNDSVDADTAPGAPVAEGTFLKAQGSPHIYRIAGGAPLKVNNWGYFGGPQPVVEVSQTRFRLLPHYPRNGAFLQAAGSGHVFRVSGGVATFVPSWAAFGGPQPTTVVDPKALDLAGIGGPWNHLKSSSPSVSMTAPTDLVTGGGSARLSWEGAISSSAVRNYDVRYVKARYDQTFGAPTYLRKWQRTRATHTSKSMPHGYTYCFSVRARNYAGKTTGWSRARCAARTLDDRSLTTLKGFSRKKKRGYYGGTYTRTTKYGSQLILRGARVDRIGIIATTCRRCGRVQVRVKGRKVGAINLYSSSYRRQQLLMLPRFTTRHGDVVLRVTSSNGKWVEIDGLAASRK